MASKFQKRSALSLKVKMEVLQLVDASNRSKTDICKEFGIPNSTLSTIIKNRKKITYAFEKSKFEPERKRIRTTKYEDLEAALLIWYKQARTQGAPVSGPILMEKADTLAKELGIEFNSNPGWLERFKMRNGIVLKNVGGESEQIAFDKALCWYTSTLPSVLRDYPAEDIFNIDETGLFYNCLPDETLAFKDGQCSDRMESREHFTLMVACNSDGSEKLPLFVVGKFLNPNYFETVKKLPIEYSGNEEAWLTASIFTDWMIKLEKRFLREKRKVAFILDNSSAHPNIEKLEAINLIFLPTNVTCILQPCELGIVRNLKFFYRKLLLQKYLSGIELSEEFSTMSVLDALHLLHKAWRSVTPKTIENCFHLAGFSFPSTSYATLPSTSDVTVPMLLYHDTAVEEDAADVFQHVSSILNLTTNVTMDDYVAIDKDIATAMSLTDNDIVDIVRRNAIDDNESEESAADDDNDGLASTPSATEIHEMLKSVWCFLEAQSDGEDMYETLDDLEKYVEHKIISNAIQSKIADFLPKK